MLTRRHIRVKVMQCLYALLHTKSGSLEDQEKFLKHSIGQTYTLYLLLLGFLRELHEMAISQRSKGANKYIKTKESADPDPKYLCENTLLKWLSENTELTEALEKRKLKQWYLHEDYVKNVYRKVLESSGYAKYNAVAGDWDADRTIFSIFSGILLPPTKRFLNFWKTKVLLGWMTFHSSIRLS